MKSTERKAILAKQRARHHAALKRIASRKCKLTGLQIWRKLRRLEFDATRITTALCNGEVEQESADMGLDAIRLMVADVFGREPKGFFINRDPRGSSLKLNPDDTGGALPEGMWKDWGGYGILAAEIN